MCPTSYASSFVVFVFVVVAVAGARGGIEVRSMSGAVLAVPRTTIPDGGSGFFSWMVTPTDVVGAGGARSSAPTHESAVGSRTTDLSALAGSGHAVVDGRYGIQSLPVPAMAPTAPSVDDRGLSS